MKTLNRNDEALGVLKNLFDDMVNYCQRHPQFSSVRKLQTITCHNLAVSAREQNDLWSVLNWVYHIKNIMANYRMEYPHRCYELVKWAETTQSILQTANHYPEITRGG
jgi:hypothetical protein